MKKILVSISLAACGLLGQPVLAQSPMPITSTSTSGDTLYKKLGEKPGLVRLMDDFMVRLLADTRTGPHFKPTNQQNIKTQLVEQFCVVAGGPCVYKGADMKSAHSSLDISKSDFNALVEVLQLSMDAQSIPFGTQNQLLARLAPMSRDVITVD